MILTTYERLEKLMDESKIVPVIRKSIKELRDSGLYDNKCLDKLEESMGPDDHQDRSAFRGIISAAHTEENNKASEKLIKLLAVLTHVSRVLFGLIPDAESDVEKILKEQVDKALKDSELES